MRLPMPNPPPRSGRKAPPIQLPRVRVGADGALARDFGPSRETRGPAFRDVLLMVAAGATTGAAAIHFAVFGHEWDHHAIGGGLLAALAWLQVMWAAGMRNSPSEVLLGAGIVLNLTAITLFILGAVSPVGLDYRSKNVATVGLAATALEAVAALTLAVVIGPFSEVASRKLNPRTVGIAAALVTIVTILVSTTAIVRFDNS